MANGPSWRMEHSTPLRRWIAAPDVVPGNHLSPWELHGGWCFTSSASLESNFFVTKLNELTFLSVSVLSLRFHSKVCRLTWMSNEKLKINCMYFLYKRELERSEDTGRYNSCSSFVLGRQFVYRKCFFWKIIQSTSILFVEDSGNPVDVARTGWLCSSSGLEKLFENSGRKIVVLHYETMRKKKFSADGGREKWMEKNLHALARRLNVSPSFRTIEET